MLVIVSILIFIIFIFQLPRSPYKALLFAIATKSILDATWDEKIAGINLLMIVGGLIPVLYLRLITKRSKSFPKWFIRLTVFYFIATTLAFVWGIFFNSFGSVIPLFFKALNGVMAIVLFPTFFNSPRQFKDLLKVLLICGIFPVVVGVYQAFTGVVIQYHSTIGREFVRLIGFYHDIVTTRFYCFQTIIAIFLYMSYFKISITRKLLFYSYGFLCMVVVYHGYTKAGYGIIATWLFLYILIYRPKYLLLYFFVGIISIWWLFNSRVMHAIEVTYQKEIQFNENELSDNRRIFAGRGYIWQTYIEKWNNSPMFVQLLGAGSPNNAHNEFLRILISNGLLGVFFYIIFFFIIVFKTTFGFLKNNKPITFAAILVLVMYLIDSTGVTPGIYPSYLWFTFGMIMLSFTKLSKIPIREFERLAKVPQQKASYAKK